MDDLDGLLATAKELRPIAQDPQQLAKDMGWQAEDQKKRHDLHLCHRVLQKTDRFCVSRLVCEQGATGVPEERWPTKTSPATRANVPAELVTCCSRCGLLSWWFMHGSMVKGYCVC